MTAKPPDRIDNEGTVEVHVDIAAEPGTVWTFFSDAARFAQWIGAYAGQAPLAGTRIEPRVGGQVRVAYPGGQAAIGRITSMQDQKRVAFTWGYENAHEGIQPESTSIEITLSPAPSGTRVTLRHSGLAAIQARKDHLGGWRHYLSMLARDSTAAQHAERLPRAVESYFRAWGEADEAARRALLADCCEADVQVRTGFAVTDGCEELSAHIANALKHMPGMLLKADGAAQQIHGFARVGWVVQTPDGTTIMKGQNFMILSTGTKLTAVASFLG